jgi:hypothetical protein
MKVLEGRKMSDIFKEGSALQTVDPNYSSWLKLVFFLVKMNVITVSHTCHRISATASMLGAGPKPKPHWIQCAIVSLSLLEYIEIVPGPRKRNADQG